MDVAWAEKRITIHSRLGTDGRYIQYIPVRSVTFLLDTCRMWAYCGIHETLVHGDYHESNCAQKGGTESTFHPLDWEYDFIGYPLMEILEGVLRDIFECSSSYPDHWEMYFTKGKVYELRVRSLMLQKSVAAKVVLWKD